VRSESSGAMNWEFPSLVEPREPFSSASLTMNAAQLSKGSLSAALVCSTVPGVRQFRSAVRSKEGAAPDWPSQVHLQSTRSLLVLVDDESWWAVVTRC